MSGTSRNLALKVVFDFVIIYIIIPEQTSCGPKNAITSFFLMVFLKYSFFIILFGLKNDFCVLFSLSKILIDHRLTTMLLILFS
jgi:hypothetical protein